MPIFNCLNVKYLTVSCFRFAHYISYSELLLVLHFSLFVYIKSFKELSSFVLPFHRESVCKGKADFSIHQIFSKFFRKNFSFEPRRQFLALLFVYKIRYSSPFRPFSECHLYSRSLSKADAKVRTFFFPASISTDFFEEILRFFVNGL